MNPRRTPSPDNRKKSIGESRSAASERRYSTERPTFKQQKKKLSEIERRQMEIHLSRGFSTGELDRFLWFMLVLIVTVTFVSLYFTGNL